MKIEIVRKLAEKEEVDYQFLLSALSEYSYPRDKISEWLKSGDLIRVKKGLYIFGKNVALMPYSLEILANLIYGPSAISLNYALAHHGLIPEQVKTVTSVTSKRNKSFSTPIAEFTYQYLNDSKYSIGIELARSSDHHHFLIASPEKALCDYIHLIDKKVTFDSFDNISAYLFHDLRIDEGVFRSLRVNQLNKIGHIYKDARLELLSKFFKKWK